LITTLISLYIIFCVGLDWFWTIGNSPNADKINLVLINLSYSYIAGFIFYILVSDLPYRLKIEKLKPVIKSKINDLYNQINACAQTFETEEINNIIEDLTLEELTMKINNNDMYNNSFYATMFGLQRNNFEFLNDTKENVFNIIDSLLRYKEYMKTEQVLTTEKIKDSDFFQLVKVYQDTPNTRSFYSNPQFKNALANDLYEVIKFVKKLKKST